MREADYFKNKKFPVLRGQEEKRIFQGSARKATQVFPQNINVAAVLSLAGIGADKTCVEIWTSNAYRRNQHEVVIKGASGEIKAQTSNLPSKTNPKTSALAIYSAIAALRKIFSPVQIGT